MKYIITILIYLTFSSSNAFSATECPNVQYGLIVSSAATYSDCTVDLMGTPFYMHLSTFNSGNDIQISGNSIVSQYMPQPGAAVNSGVSTGGVLVGLINKGAGYTGDCPVVSSADPSEIPAVAGNVYCGIVESDPAGVNLWIRSTWNGTSFENTTIAYSSTMLPVKLQSFEID